MRCEDGVEFVVHLCQSAKPVGCNGQVKEGGVPGVFIVSS